jgi:elongation factor G
MEERLGANAVPIQWPMGQEDSFRGIIDLVEMRAYTYLDDLGQNIEESDIPAEYAELAEAKRGIMLEKLADISDDLAMLYLEGEEIPSDVVKALFARAS